jgi:hypothetical protein
VDAGTGSGSPIIHASYDFNHLHTISSFGDTWDTAWADDGNLYSTYDDGLGFTNTRSNFGIAKITGNATLSGNVYDVSGLAGSPDNSMSSYGPMCNYPWWKTGGLTSVDGALYLFASPDGNEESTGRQTGGAVSLLKSTDHGATWSTPVRDAAAASTNFDFEDGTLKQWTVALAPGGSSAVGFRSSTICNSVLSSHYAILGGQGTHITKTLSGLAANTHYRVMVRAWADSGSTVRVDAKADDGSFDVHADTKRTSAGYADFMSLDFNTGGGAPSVTIDVSNLDGSTTGKVYAGYFRILPSTFPGMSFGAPSFVKYGKDGAASVDGADKYVYAVSNNGYFANGDYAILGRVPRTAIGKLRDSDWQFYRGCIGGDGSDDANWTDSITDASVTKILDAPGNVGMVDITYIEPLHRYILLDWGWAKQNDGRFRRNGTTTLDTYEGPYPWGPWTKIASVQSMDPEAFYDPHVITKFTKVDPTDANKVHLLLSAAGEWYGPLSNGHEYYRFTLVPMTISTD